MVPDTPVLCGGWGYGRGVGSTGLKLGVFHLQAG